MPDHMLRPVVVHLCGPALAGSQMCVRCGAVLVRAEDATVVGLVEQDGHAVGTSGLLPLPEGTRLAIRTEEDGRRYVYGIPPGRTELYGSEHECQP